MCWVDLDEGKLFLIWKAEPPFAGLAKKFTSEQLQNGFVNSQNRLEMLLERLGTLSSP